MAGKPSLPSKCRLWGLRTNIYLRSRVNSESCKERLRESQGAETPSKVACIAIVVHAIVIYQPVPSYNMRKFALTCW